MGLFEAGCPEDEYEDEISELQNSIQKEDSEEAIAKKYMQFLKNNLARLLTIQLKIAKK